MEVLRTFYAIRLPCPYNKHRYLLSH